MDREDVKRAFNLRKQRWGEILKGFKQVKEAGKPMAGPWYLVYLAPNWVVRNYPEDSNEIDSLDHVDYWAALAPDVAKHYGIKDVQSVADLPYCMPRGRVVFRKMPDGRSEWTFYHGRDFNYDDAFKRQLISAYDLYRQAQAGLVRFEPDPHENMSGYEHQRFLSLIKKKFDQKGLAKQLNKVPSEMEMADFDD